MTLGKLQPCLLQLSTSLMSSPLTNAREKVVADSRDFDILQWWEGMSARLPLMHKCVRRTLSVPHTSCDVERTFLVWKRLRSDK